jgi:hypothetical protein
MTSRISTATHTQSRDAHLRAPRDLHCAATNKLMVTRTPWQQCGLSGLSMNGWLEKTLPHSLPRSMPIFHGIAGVGELTSRGSVAGCVSAPE